MEHHHLYQSLIERLARDGAHEWEIDRIVRNAARADRGPRRRRLPRIPRGMRRGSTTS